MKRTWMTIIFAAATTAATAMAEGVTANIPFDFSANGGNLPAGQYQVTRVNSIATTYKIRMQNVETGRAVILVSGIGIDRESASPSKLVFSCRGVDCSVAQVFLPGESVGHAFPGPKAKGAAQERKVAVLFGSSSAAGF
ncbi:MAG: hypothetical protein HY820_24510 [Acidobacteria bacterium]|nr:hypothetical protein [Acidobacteriota bacterium]